MRYTPPPLQGLPYDELLVTLERELRKIATITSETILEELHAAPNKLIEGMVVLADGTDWNPGSGAGYYGYRGGSWTFLG